MISSTRNLLGDQGWFQDFHICWTATYWCWIVEHLCRDIVECEQGLVCSARIHELSARMQTTVWTSASKGAIKVVDHHMLKTWLSNGDAPLDDDGGAAIYSVF